MQLILYTSADFLDSSTGVFGFISWPSNVEDGLCAIPMPYGDKILVIVSDTVIMGGILRHSGLASLGFPWGVV